MNNRTKYLLTIFSISAFLLRLLPWKNTIIDWGRWILFVQPDAYYHLRRASIWAYNFPKIITLDYYMAYPFGAECPWPPLYDWLIALLSLIFGLGRYNEQVINLITALLPPILAGMCVVPTYLTVKLIWKNERVALMSSFFAIIMPGMLGYSTIASGDHHIAETLIGLWFYYYALKVVVKGKENVSINKDILLSGLFIAVGLLVWQGEVVFYTIFAVYLIILFIINKDNVIYIKKVSQAFLLSALFGSVIVASIRYIIPRGTTLSLFNFGYFSYFQPLYIFFVYISVFLFGKLIIFYKKNRRLFLLICCGIFLTLLLFTVIKPLRVGIWDGINFLFKTDPWHSSINEFQTTFNIKSLMDFKSVDGWINILYFLTFLLPFFYSIKYFYNWLYSTKTIIGPYFLNIKKQQQSYIKKENKFSAENVKIIHNIKKDNISKTIFFAVIAISFFLLASYQKRWTNSYSPILAIGLALLANSIYEKVKSGHSLVREFLHWKANKRKDKIGLIQKIVFFGENSPVVMAGIIILVILLPYFVIAESLLLREGYPIPGDLYNSLQWIRRYTPPTSHLLKPDKKPEYGILAVWDHGHYIQHIAQRPTIVNNFGHQLPGDGFRIATYIWSVETEEELKSILDKYNIRYLLLNDPIPFFNPKSDAYTKEGFFQSNFDLVPSHFGASIATPKEEFLKKPLVNAWMFDGSSNGYRSASRVLRLVFESENPSIMQYIEGIELKNYKLFEYVKGAKIKGKAKPRDIIYIRSEFVTNFDRIFEWEAAAIANDNGEFEGILPYATSEDNLFVKPLSPYYFFTKEKMYRIYTTNDDVEKGNEISVDLTKGDNIPDIMKNEVREKISSLAGKVKSKSYIKIHRKLNEK